MNYRGVWREGGCYEPGDVVIYAGSAWECEIIGEDKPGTVGGSWKLIRG